MNEFLNRYEQLGHPMDPVTRSGPSLRVNTLLTTTDAIVKRLGAKGVELEKVPYARDAYWIKKTPFSLGATTEYLRGLYYLQDAAAQVPVQVLDPKPGETILDCCSAPGGKTTQMAQWMDNKGAIVSFENSVHRMMSLKANLERCAVSNTVIYAADATAADKFGIVFDKILVDAPCSGNFASDPNWLTKRTIEDAKRNTPVQQKLLQAACAVLKTGGTLVYSTCSLEPEENEFIIDWAVANLPLQCVDTGLTVGDPGIVEPFGKKLHSSIAHARRLWPVANKNEGFFIAKLVKYD